MLYIGVDLGTSAVKLLLMDENGNIHKIVSREYPLYFPHPGWSEQKPEDWFAQSMEGIRELTAECDKSQDDLKIRLTEFPHHLAADAAGGTVILYYSV